MMGGMGSMMAGGYLWAVLILVLLAVVATGAVIAVVLTLRHTTPTRSPNSEHAAAMDPAAALRHRGDRPGRVPATFSHHRCRVGRPHRRTMCTPLPAS